MSEPPRRRRSAPPPRRASRGPSVLPTIALGIGVVVAGLGIGAFLSALQSKNGTPFATPSGGLAVVTPVAQPTRGPVAIATIVSHARPSATPQPTPSISAAPTASALATASAAPSAEPTRTAHPTPSPTAAAAKATQRPSARPEALAAARTTAAPIPVYVPPSVAPRVAAATVRPFAAQADSTVRRYLDDLIAGNESGAYAAFGTTPGDPNVSLREEAFIDRGTRVASVRTTHVDATGATVEAEIVSAHGSYLARFHVSGGPSGPVIDGHDYIRE
jgi:hypothetical protein